MIACNGADKDSGTLPPDDTDSTLEGTHDLVDCSSPDCGVEIQALGLTLSNIGLCLSGPAQTLWTNAGWTFASGAKLQVVSHEVCETQICLDSCDAIGGEGAVLPLCQTACLNSLTQDLPLGGTEDPAHWNQLFEEQMLPGCPITTLGATLQLNVCSIQPDCTERPNYNEECSSPQAGADFDFVVDPGLSTTVITVSGVGTASVPMSGRLYVSSSPSEFLAGSVDGPGIALAGVTYAATHAWFDIPIDIATSGLSFTVTPAEASKAWAAGFISSSNLFEFYDLQPTQTTTGSINPTAGTWQLSYTVYKPFGSIVVTMAGAIEVH